MPPREWVEVNIHFRGSWTEARRIILDFVKPFVDSHRGLKQSWHYFQEVCPPNGERPGEPEIRLRFFGKSSNVATIRTNLTRDLTRLIASGQSPVTSFHFGNHGGPGQYTGEAGYWGKDWTIAMHQYQNGAEFGLLFLSKYPIQQQPTIPIGRHGHRYVHLLLNQMTVPHQYAGPVANLTVPE